MSTVRTDNSTIGFLQSPRRINVALTRAKHGMIIVGHAPTLSNEEEWGEMIEFFEYENTLVTYKHAKKRLL